MGATAADMAFAPHRAAIARYRRKPYKSGSLGVSDLAQLRHVDEQRAYCCGPYTWDRQKDFFSAFQIGLSCHNCSDSSIYLLNLLVDLSDASLFPVSTYGTEMGL